MVKLLDFGLVKDSRPSADPSLTQTNAITGTPLYLAPETILDPATIDHRVDLYALGAVGYCMLTGERRRAAGAPTTRGLLGRVARSGEAGRRTCAQSSQLMRSSHF